MADFSRNTTLSEIWSEVGLFVTALVTMFPIIAADNAESNLDEMVDMRLRSVWLLADIQSCRVILVHIWSDHALIVWILSQFCWLLS